MSTRLEEIKKRREGLEKEIEEKTKSVWPGGVYQWDFIPDIDWLIRRVERLESYLSCSCCGKLVVSEENRFCNTQCKDKFWNARKRQKRIGLAEEESW